MKAMRSLGWEDGAWFRRRMLMGSVNSRQPVQDILVFVVALLRFYAESRSRDE